jgi:hypothetical protein
MAFFSCQGDKVVVVCSVSVCLIRGPPPPIRNPDSHSKDRHSRDHHSRDRHPNCASFFSSTWKSVGKSMYTMNMVIGGMYRSVHSAHRRIDIYKREPFKNRKIRKIRGEPAASCSGSSSWQLGQFSRAGSGWQYLQFHEEVM